MRRPNEEQTTPWDPTHIDEYRVYHEEARGTLGPDCNANGTTDWLETSATRFGFLEERGPFPVDDRPVQVLSIDLDGNGQREIVTLNTTNTDAEDGSLSIVRDVSIAANDLTSERVSMLESPWVRAMAAGDMDEDGDTDIVVLHETRDYVGVSHYTAPALRVYLNDGDGNLTAPLPRAVGDRYDDPYALAAVDLDGDRDLDLVITRKDAGIVGSAEYRVSIFTNESDSGDTGVLSGPSNIATFDGFPGSSGDAIPPGLNGIAAANVDEEPDLELIVPYCQWGTWPEYHCNAPAGVAVLTRRPYGSAWDTIEIELGDVPRSVAAADLNRDGRPDLAVTRRDANDLVILINTGTGEISPSNPDYFSEPVAYDMGDEPWAFELTDLNNDGDPDIVATNRGSGGISVRMNLGDGRFSRRATYPAGDLPASVAAGRLGSGVFRDLAVANATGGDVTVLWNESVSARTPDCNRNRIPDSCDIADGTSADMDRNGIPDECPSLRPPPRDRPVIGREVPRVPG